MSQTIQDIVALLKERKPNGAKKWLAGVLAALVVAVATEYATHRVDSAGVISDYHVRMTACEEDVEALAKWQTDWVDHGMLKWDVEQNKELEILHAEIARLSTRLDSR
jgi:hypothetical protein